MQSEDELVSVLAHEIGHIVKRHLASRVEKGTYTSVASLGLALAAVAFGGAAAPALLTGALATGQSMNLHFSRQHEEEADLLAYGWMKKLERNPEAQAKMLETMRRIARYRSDRLPQYLLTHPNPEARLNYIESLLDIDRQELQRQPMADNDFTFTRFKYRVMSKTQDPRSFRAYLANIAGDKQRAESAKIMAGYGLALLAHAENNHDLALAELAQVINGYPDEEMLQVDKGVFLFSAGRIAEAEQVLRNALQSNSNNMYAAFTLAKLLYRTGRLDEAEEYFNRVRYELPEYAKVYFEIGQIAADRKEQGVASFYLGKFNLYEGKLPLAEHHLQSALRHQELPEKMRTEAKELQKKIALLQK
jgi:predicted Zn-dependent protease